MRKLSENVNITEPQNKGSSPSVSKAVKICGYVLFLLGTATLFAIVYFYRFYAEIPVPATIVAAAELAAGFMQIKCAGQVKYQKLSLIIDAAAAGVLLIIICFYPDMLKLPAYIGLGALAVSVVISLLRLLNKIK